MESGVKCKCGEIVEPKFVGYAFERWVFINGKRYQGYKKVYCQGYKKVYCFSNCPKCKEHIFPPKPET